MRKVDTKEYLDTLCQLLDQGAGLVSTPVEGSSMCPFLYPGDTVRLALPGKKRKNGGIYLFQRPSGSYILHRLLKTDARGTLWMLGDNQALPEPIAPQWIRAEAVSVVRRGKNLTPRSLAWRFFAGPWRWLWGLRRLRAGLSAGKRR